MKRIRRLPRSIEDLDDIWADIFLDNPAAADKILNRLVDATSRLRHFPESGTPRPGMDFDLRSISVRPYIIYYRVTDDTVDILRIIHGARDVRPADFA